MGKREHLVPEVISDKNGKTTTVHKNKNPKVKTKPSAALTSAVPSAVKRIEKAPKQPKDKGKKQKPPQEAVITPEPTATETVTVAPKVFEPKPEWGNTHLNRRNFRIIDGIKNLNKDVQAQVLSDLSDKSDVSKKDYAGAIGASLGKFDAVPDFESNNTIEVPENIYEASEKRYNLLTNLSRDEEACAAIGQEINRVNGDPEYDVDAEDVKLAVELLRDATSDRDTALQARAYAIRTKREDIIEKRAELDRQIAELEAPLRGLVTGQTGEQYTYDLGGDDGYAKIEFTPRKTFNPDLALKDMSKSELKSIQVKNYDWALAKDIVGSERYEQYRVQGTTAVTIR